MCEKSEKRSCVCEREKKTKTNRKNVNDDILLSSIERRLPLPQQTRACFHEFIDFSFSLHKFKFSLSLSLACLAVGYFLIFLEVALVFCERF